VRARELCYVAHRLMMDVFCPFMMCHYNIFVVVVR
jgi:hypothetical protein